MSILVHLKTCNNAHSNFIHDGPSLETIEISINKEVDKLLSIHIIVYYIVIKIKRIYWYSENMDRSHRTYVVSKKPDIDNIYCMIPCIQSSRIGKILLL